MLLNQLRVRDCFYVDGDKSKIYRVVHVIGKEKIVYRLHYSTDATSFPDGHLHVASESLDIYGDYDNAVMVVSLCKIRMAVYDI